MCYTKRDVALPFILCLLGLLQKHEICNQKIKSFSTRNFLSFPETVSFECNKFIAVLTLVIRLVIINQGEIFRSTLLWFTWLSINNGITPNNKENRKNLINWSATPYLTQHARFISKVLRLWLSRQIRKGIFCSNCKELGKSLFKKVQHREKDQLTLIHNRFSKDTFFLFSVFWSYYQIFNLNCISICFLKNLYLFTILWNTNWLQVLYVRANIFAGNFQVYLHPNRYFLSLSTQTNVRWTCIDRLFVFISRMILKFITRAINQMWWLMRLSVKLCFCLGTRWHTYGDWNWG